MGQDGWPRLTSWRRCRWRSTHWGTTSRWCCRDTAHVETPGADVRTASPAAGQPHARCGVARPVGVAAPPRRVRGRAGVLRPRRAVRRRRGGVCRQRRPLRSAVAGGAGVRARRRRAGSTSFTRTTGRPRRRSRGSGPSRRAGALGRAGAVLTIHNLAYQGVFPRESVPPLGLPWDVFHDGRRRVLGSVQLSESRHHRGGLRDDRQPDVRERDADQRRAGAGLEGVLRACGDRYVGILNGIDTQAWNPATDPHAAGALQRGRSGRQGGVQAGAARASSVSRAATMRWRRPLVGMVSRLVAQKGLDLIDRCGAQLVELDATWVFMGQGDAKYEHALRALAAKYPVARGRPHRVRRGPRASGGSGRRSLPDAVRVRAVRPEPDVQPALRHGADRAGGRRPATTRFSRIRRAPSTPTGSSSGTTRRTGSCACVQQAAPAVSQSGRVAEADPERDDSRPLMGHIGPGIWQSVQTSSRGGCDENPRGGGVLETKG